MYGNLNFVSDVFFLVSETGDEDTGGCPLPRDDVPLFKLLTENYVKIWHQCDIMAIAVLNGQFARFMVGKFLIS